MASQRAIRKTSIWIALAATQTLFQVGCSLGGANTQAAPEPKGIVLGVTDLGANVALAEDDILTVKLPALASAGYAWEVQDVDQGVLKLEATEHESAPVIGGTDTQTLRFSGVAKGSTMLTLVYRRSWEQTPANASTFTAGVDVPGPYKGSFVPRKYDASAAALTTGPLTGSGLPSSFKLCDGSGGGCTPVRDQTSNCGSCWAFATAGTFENVLSLSASASFDLSEQYLVSCNDYGWGCAGGGGAFDMYINTHRSSEPDAGAVYESNFPYTATDAACGSGHPHHEKLTSWSLINGHTPGVAEIKRAMVAHGPIFIGVCADGDFQGYQKGTIFHGSNCTSSNHAVVLTGWDDNGGDGYWILRNSWGPGWGENGYMRIAYGVNQVAVDAVYVVYDGYTPPPNGGGNYVNQLVSLRVTTPGFNDRYIRHKGGLGYTEVVNSSSDDLTRQDSSFWARPGLANGSCYSFESRNFPGEYLRHSSSRIHKDPNDGSDLFKADATFCARGGLSGVGYSFEAYNYPNHFLRHYNGEVYIAVSGGSNAFESSNNFNADTSWNLTPAWWRSGADLPVDQTRSFQVVTSGFTDRYLRHKGGLGYTDVINGSSDDGTKQDGTFTIRRGLADPSCYSFESRNFPNDFLRHNGFRIHKDTNDGSGLFKSDATFCAQPGLNGSSDVSIAPYALPAKFLRHKNGEAWVGSGDGSDAGDGFSGTFNADATWHVANAWAP